MISGEKRRPAEYPTRSERTLHPAPREEVIRLYYRMRRPIPEIARTTGRSRAAVGFIVQAADESRDWATIDPTIRALYEQDMKLRQIAAEVGLTVGVVSARVHLLGLWRPDIRALGIEHKRARDRDWVRAARARRKAPSPHSEE